MWSAPETRQTLLARLQNLRDEQAWHEFWTLYRPVVYRLARRRGLQDADAHEVTQDVMTAVARHLEQRGHNPARGRFHHWLATCTRNAAVNLLIARSRRPLATGESAMAEFLNQAPAPHCEASQWFTQEEQRQQFLRASAQVQTEFEAKSWRAFWETGVCARPVADVARELRISTGAVYIARSRIMKRLRQIVEQQQEPSP